MMKPEARETRIGTIAAVGIAVVAGVWVLSNALGFQTPAAQSAELKEHDKTQDAKLEDHETRIQKLEDQSAILEAIAKAVDADVPKKRGK